MELMDRICILKSKEDEVADYRLQIIRSWDKQYIENRTILVEWIGEVCELNNFNLKTFELSVRYADIYLARCEVSLKEFQLVAISSILLARKFYEPHTYSQDFEFLNSFESIEALDEIKRMELQIIKCLSWNLNIVVPSDYGDVNQKSEQYETTIRYLMLDPCFLFYSCFEMFLIAYFSCFEVFPISLTENIAQRVESGLKELQKQLGIDYKSIETISIEKDLSEFESTSIYLPEENEIENLKRLETIASRNLQTKKKIRKRGNYVLDVVISKS